MDASLTDADVMNITATADPVAMDVTNVETININWDSYGTPDVDLDNVTGATVVLTSAKSGYLGNANFTNVGENKISVGAGIVGDVDIEGAEDTTITATAARSLDIGGTTNADGTMIINAGVATDVTMVGGDDVTLTGLSANDISLTGGGDSATLNLGVSADVTFTGAADAALTIDSASDITVTVETASVYETLAVTGAGKVALSMEAIADLDAKTVTGATSIAVEGAIDTADLTGIALTTPITFELEAGGNEVLTVATGQSFVFEDAESGVHTVTFQTGDDDSTADSVNITLEDIQGGALIFDTADAEIETVNLTVAPNSDFDTDDDFTIADLQGNSAAKSKFVITSTNTAVAVVLTAADAAEIDASAVKGSFELTAQTTDETITVIGSATGNNTITDIKGGSTATTSGTYVGGTGDDDVTFTGDAGEMTALVGEGDNTITANAVDTGLLAVIAGSGDDTVSATALTTGTVALNLGDGDNEVTLDGTFNGISASITLGAGDDTVTVDDATVAADEIIIAFGAGTDTLAISEDITAGTFTLTGLEALEITDSATVVDASLLTGKSYTIKASGTLNSNNDGFSDVLDVTTATAGSYDFSGLTISTSLTTGLLGLDITGHSGNDTIIATAAADTIATNGGNDKVTGGAGADTITLGAGTDTVVINSGDSGNVLNLQGSNLNTIDRIVSFVSGTDKIDMAVAGTSTNYTEVDGAGATTFAAALTLARTALTGDVKYAYVYSVDDTAAGLALATDGITASEGILVYDADGVDGGETVIVLAGTANAAFFAYTDIV